MSFYLSPTIACLVCHRLNTSPVYIPSGLSSSLPSPRPAMGGDCVLLPLPYHSLPWEETVSFYLSPTIACLVCHRLNTSPVYIPVVSPLASHLPGLPWEETVSFYLSPTIACLVCHRLNTSPVYIPSGLSSSLPPPRPAMGGDCVLLPLPYHSLPWEDIPVVSPLLCPSTSPLP